MRNWCCQILFLFFSVYPVYAGTFDIPQGLREEVHFWTLVFVKYDKDQVVFHRRSDLGVIYSVLNFSKLRNSLSPGEFERTKAQSLKVEESRIRRTLQSLALGQAPDDNFSRRIQEVFSRYPVHRRQREYALAAEGDDIRSQTGIKDQFYPGLLRSRRYLYAIEEIFEKEGLTQEITRIPVVES